MQPITPPPSLPRPVRPKLQIRGRSPAPKSRTGHSRPAPIITDPSPSSSSSSSEDDDDLLFRSESPELMFPMSPVLADEKEMRPFDHDLVVRPTTHFPYPIIVNLESAIRKPRQLTSIIRPDSQNDKENVQHHQHKDPKSKFHQHRRRQTTTKSEPLILNPFPMAPAPSYPKLTAPTTSNNNSKTANIPRRLPSFLNSNPTPSVMESPTAVTVHRSSQPNGHSSLVMKEHTSLPPSPSQPLQILTPSPSQSHHHHHHPSATVSDISEIEKAMAKRQQARAVASSTRPPLVQHKPQQPSDGGGDPFHFDGFLKKMKKSQQK